LPKGAARGPGWVGVDEEGGCIRWPWCCGFMFGAFIGKEGAFEVVGMKEMLAPDEAGMLPPYGELEYGV